MELTTGYMITQKRIENKLTLRRFASAIGKSATYVSLMESNLQIPTQSIIEKIVEVLHFDKDDTEELIFLVSQTKKSHLKPADNNFKVGSNSPVIIALRTVKELEKREKEWVDFVRTLN